MIIIIIIIITDGNPHRAQMSQFELFDLEFVHPSFSSLSSC